jgi:hypothetical protein
MKGAHLLILCALLACTPKPEAPAPEFVWKDVTYQFGGQLSGADRSISGTVRALGKQIVIDAQPGPCRKAGQGEAGMYVCDDVYLFVDMTENAPRVHYSTSTIVTEYKTTCVRYGFNAAGQSVCAETQRDRIERRIPVTGTLRLVEDGSSR